MKRTEDKLTGIEKQLRERDQQQSLLEEENHQLNNDVGLFKQLLQEKEELQMELNDSNTRLHRALETLNELLAQKENAVAKANLAMSEKEQVRRYTLFVCRMQFAIEI